jgi:hypothetical protein
LLGFLPAIGVLGFIVFYWCNQYHSLWLDKNLQKLNNCYSYFFSLTIISFFSAMIEKYAYWTLIFKYAWKYGIYSYFLDFPESELTAHSD